MHEQFAQSRSASFEVPGMIVGEVAINLPQGRVFFTAVAA